VSPDGARKIWRQEGLTGLYRGLIPSLFGVSHGVVQFVTYEELKKWRRATTGRDTIQGKEGLAAGAISKIIAGVSTYPYTVVKSRLQMRPPPGQPHPYAGVVDVIRKTWRYYPALPQAPTTLLA
jgi:solute carrier family 25 folate transporter 32